MRRRCPGRQRLAQPQQVGRIVREVGVHLEDVVVVARQRPHEPFDVRGPKPALACAVHDVDAARLHRGQPVDDLPVPSGELSSTTSTSRSADWARMAVTIGSMFSRSL